MSQTIGLHISAAVAALLLGILVLVQAKGTYRHKLIGRFWVVLMFTVAITSLWIRDLNEGALSGIHLLTALTVYVADPERHSGDPQGICRGP